MLRHNPVRLSVTFGDHLLGIDSTPCLPSSPTLPILVRVAGWALAVFDLNGAIVTDTAVKKWCVERACCVFAWCPSMFFTRFRRRPSARSPALIRFCFPVQC